MAELKPCPFCGGNVGLLKLTNIVDMWTAIGTFKCLSCLTEIQMESRYRDNPVAALEKAWNRRAEDGKRKAD